MNKISIISSHINRCDELIQSNDLSEINDFITEMSAVYVTEIDEFTSYLNTYSISRMYEKMKLSDAVKDVRIIKSMLENYKSNLKSGLVKSSAAQTIITNNNTAQSSSITNINLSMEQIINNINELADDIISREEKEELEDRLIALENIVNTGDKDKINTRLVKLFNFALEKGPAVVSLVSSAVSLLNDKILPLFIK